MKKALLVIIIITSLIFMGSCSEQERTPEETSKIIGDNSNPIKFNYDGHKYIKFAWGFGKYRVAGVVHDPDCECNNDK